MKCHETVIDIAQSKQCKTGYLCFVICLLPISVAALFKAWVCGLSLVEILGSKPSGL